MAGKPAKSRQEGQMAIANRVEASVGSKEDAGSKIMRHAGLLSGQLQQLRT
ncbi:plasmid partitioning protein RepA, partial [Mesorhizobium sp. M1A.T.Ca.IN.004.03.1.1]